MTARPSGKLRSAVLVGSAGVVVVLALLLGVLWLAQAGTEVEIRIGDQDFRNLDAQRISDEIAERGPVLFSDLAGGSRDIILQHQGNDIEVGWTAFAARRPGQPRDCFFEWQPASTTSDDDGRFRNSCDAGDIVDAVGTGLVHYPVTVNDGDVRVDINNPTPDSVTQDP